jgi:hypothetical protein
MITVQAVAVDYGGYAVTFSMSQPAAEATHRPRVQPAAEPGRRAASGR